MENNLQVVNMNDEINLYVNLYVIIKKDLKTIDFQVFNYTICDPAGNTYISILLIFNIS